MQKPTRAKVKGQRQVLSSAAQREPQAQRGSDEPPYLESKRLSCGPSCNEDFREEHLT